MERKKKSNIYFEKLVFLYLNELNIITFELYTIKSILYYNL